MSQVYQDLQDEQECLDVLALLGRKETMAPLENLDQRVASPVAIRRGEGAQRSGAGTLGVPLEGTRRVGSKRR